MKTTQQTWNLLAFEAYDLLKADWFAKSLPSKLDACVGFHEPGRVVYYFFCMGKIIGGGRERRSVCVHGCHMTLENSYG